jgi:hypothetical protein
LHKRGFNKHLLYYTRYCAICFTIIKSLLGTKYCGYTVIENNIGAPKMSKKLVYIEHLFYSYRSSNFATSTVFHIIPFASFLYRFLTLEHSLFSVLLFLFYIGQIDNEPKVFRFFGALILF